MTEKPPRGLYPRFLSEEDEVPLDERIQLVEEAIARYKTAGIPIPLAWEQEHRDLTSIRVSKMAKKVIAMPTKRNGDQTWRCQICGGEITYQQPMEYGKLLKLLGPFLEKHHHPEADNQP